jgi:tagatose 6-phosphate kinase
VIVTVTLNTALDVTYTVPRMVPGTSHRPDVVWQAGGKGINVARTLHALGRDVLAICTTGSSVGREIALDLSTAGLRFERVPIREASRRTVTVVETDSSALATAFNEPGPCLSGEDWALVQETVVRALGSATVLVLSGSLPRGLPSDAYGVLIAMARERSVPVILDASGAALTAALAAGPSVVKPNAEELFDVTGSRSLESASDVLRAAGAEAVVASLGPLGLRAMTTEGSWTARPPVVSEGNPTGAGDAAVAALAVGLAEGTPWPERLADAAALSAATVLTPRAGEFDAAAYRRFARQVIVDNGPPG